MLTVAAFYTFVPFDDPAALKPGIEACCASGQVTGTILLAPEGLNGTIAGPAEGVASALAHLRTLPGCGDLEWKESLAEERPFRRLKVRLKREIVTMRREVDPRAAVGRYVAPRDWNAVVDDPDVVVIDTRNAYEVEIGTFEGAVDPETAAFSDFPAWWREHGARFAGKRVAMFCTGGIRCEKATSFLIGEGVPEVMHLRGGILKYLEEVPATESRWAGHCFVFDGRVSVGHGLAEGPHVLCHGCRMPLAPEDMARPEFERGVSCHRCHATTTEADRARFRMRQRQIDAAGR